MALVDLLTDLSNFKYTDYDNAGINTSQKSGRHGGYKGDGQPPHPEEHSKFDDKSGVNLSQIKGRHGGTEGPTPAQPPHSKKHSIYDDGVGFGVSPNDNPQSFNVRGYTITGTKTFDRPNQDAITIMTNRLGFPYTPFDSGVKTGPVNFLSGVYGSWGTETLPLGFSFNMVDSLLSPGIPPVLSLNTLRHTIPEVGPSPEFTIDYSRYDELLGSQFNTVDGIISSQYSDIEKLHSSYGTQFHISGFNRGDMYIPDSVEPSTPIFNQFTRSDTPLIKIDRYSDNFDMNNSQFFEFPDTRPYDLIFKGVTPWAPMWVSDPVTGVKSNIDVTLDSTQPYIVREIGDRWGLYEGDEEDGGTHLGKAIEWANALSGEFFRAPLDVMIDRSVADIGRIAKFLTSTKGVLFLGKQFILQAFNPTIETKLYNPLSLGSVVPMVHINRHAGGKRYTDVVPSDDAVDALASLMPGIDIGPIGVSGAAIINAGLDAVGYDVPSFGRVEMQSPLATIHGEKLPLDKRVTLSNPNRFLWPGALGISTGTEAAISEASKIQKSQDIVLGRAKGQSDGGIKDLFQKISFNKFDGGSNVYLTADGIMGTPEAEGPFGFLASLPISYSQLESQVTNALTNWATSTISGMFEDEPPSDWGSELEVEERQPPDHRFSFLEQKNTDIPISGPLLNSPLAQIMASYYPGMQGTYSFPTHIGGELWPIYGHDYQYPVTKGTTPLISGIKLDGPTWGVSLLKRVSGYDIGDQGEYYAREFFDEPILYEVNPLQSIGQYEGGFSITRGDMGETNPAPAGIPYDGNMYDPEGDFVYQKDYNKGKLIPIIGTQYGFGPGYGLASFATSADIYEKYDGSKDKVIWQAETYDPSVSIDLSGKPLALTSVLKAGIFQGDLYSKDSPYLAASGTPTEPEDIDKGSKALGHVTVNNQIARGGQVTVTQKITFINKFAPEGTFTFGQDPQEQDADSLNKSAVRGTRFDHESPISHAFRFKSTVFDKDTEHPGYNIYHSSEEEKIIYLGDDASIGLKGANWQVDGGTTYGKLQGGLFVKEKNRNTFGDKKISLHYPFRKDGHSVSVADFGLTVKGEAGKPFQWESDKYSDGVGNKKRYEDSGTDKGTEKYRIQLGTASPTVKKNYIHIGPKSDSTKKPLDITTFKYDPLDKDYKPLTSTTNFSITSRGEFSGDKYSWGEPKSENLYSTQIDSRDIKKTRLQIDAEEDPTVKIETQHKNTARYLTFGPHTIKDPIKLQNFPLINSAVGANLGSEKQSLGFINKSGDPIKLSDNLYGHQYKIPLGGKRISIGDSFENDYTKKSYIDTIKNNVRAAGFFDERKPDRVVNVGRFSVPDEGLPQTTNQISYVHKEHDTFNIGDRTVTVAENLPAGSTVGFPESKREFLTNLTGNILDRYKTLAYGDIPKSEADDNRYGNNVDVINEKRTAVATAGELGADALTISQDPDLKGLVKKDGTSTGPQSYVTNLTDKVNMIKYGELGEFEYGDDYIKFKFFDMINRKNIIFRAFLSGISETVTPEWSSEKYIGRPDSVHIYTGVERSMSFEFMISPNTRQELPILWEKINYLVGLTYPTWKKVGLGKRMEAPFIQLTIGDMYNAVPGFLSSLSITVDDNSPWEIEDGFQLPHAVNVSCEFTHIGQHALASQGIHYDFGGQDKTWLKPYNVGTGKMEEARPNGWADKTGLFGV